MVRPKICASLALLVAALASACEAPTSLGTLPVEMPAAANVPVGAINGQSPSAPPVYFVEVNTKHGNSSGLPVNLRGNTNSGGSSQATLMVSVLGSAEFDLSAVYIASLRIGDINTAPATPVRLLQKKPQASVVDLNGDRILDLVLHFSIAEMVANGNLFDTTTELCLVGEGPGYLLGGCGDGSGGGGGGSGGGQGGGGRTTTVELIPFGTSPDATPENKSVWASANKSWFNDTVDQLWYPSWQTVSLADLEAPGGWPLPPFPSTDVRQFQKILTPVGGERTPGLLYSTCGLTVASMGFPVDEHLLMRADFTLPAGSSGVIIEFVVDNDAKIYLNGQEVTNGFETRTTSRQPCASYDSPVTIRVKDSQLSPDGLNKLAIWADDRGYVSFFDIRVTANIPN